MHDCVHMYHPSIKLLLCIVLNFLFMKEFNTTLIALHTSLHNASFVLNYFHGMQRDHKKNSKVVFKHTGLVCHTNLVTYFDGSILA